MKYIVIGTAAVGLFLTWFVGQPDPNTYAGERLFNQTVLLSVFILLLALELLAWLL